MSDNFEPTVLKESLLNKYIVYKMVKILLSDWKKIEAYKLGIIDRDGNRTDKKLESSKEKEAYDFFHRFIFRVKRLFEKFLGKSKITALFSMMLLFKEMDTSDIDIEHLNESQYIDLYKKIEKTLIKENQNEG